MRSSSTVLAAVLICTAALSSAKTFKTAECTKAKNCVFPGASVANVKKPNDSQTADTSNLVPTTRQDFEAAASKRDGPTDGVKSSVDASTAFGSRNKFFMGAAITSGSHSRKLLVDLPPAMDGDTVETNAIWAKIEPYLVKKTPKPQAT